MSPEDIKALRKELGMSQTVFAQKIGVTLRTLQNYEKGDTSPTADTITKMFALSGKEFVPEEMTKSGTNLVVPGATISLDQIALFVSKNESEFLQHPFVKKIIDEKVIKKVLYLVNHPEELEKYLKS